MRIGEMVRRTGVSERLLRYYEEQGLLAPTRLPSGYRVYTDADVDAVRRIRTLLAAGLPTATIAQVLPCVRDDGANLAPVCSDLVAELRRERERITHAIKNLQTTRDLLDAVIAAGPADTAAERSSSRSRRVDAGQISAG
ncbi:MerR family transcriptional regulator [Streptomyces sp. Ru71]|uniref:MerR family transcriptional regulator n=1 Tax=Streptomyces sp. Ru71 TaxID=2080746 RepID=UPI000CDDEEB0|nr:MerR family transcriptional regulator [Streptomyces sp. Ru71]POX55863.1 MerR family transcriptional regulator [Streptomyces sp. Ru71]